MPRVAVRTSGAARGIAAIERSNHAGATPGPEAAPPMAAPAGGTAPGIGLGSATGVVGATATDGDDDAPDPMALVAVTVNVSGLPPESPVTSHEVAGAFTVQLFDGSSTLVTV